jgi:hypothetical protein
MDYCGGKWRIVGDRALSIEGVVIFFLQTYLSPFSPYPLFPHIIISLICQICQTWALYPNKLCLSMPKLAIKMYEKYPENVENISKRFKNV